MCYNDAQQQGGNPSPLSPFVVVENQPSFNHSGGNGVSIVDDELF
jgi:hypothetical protein